MNRLKWTIIIPSLFIISQTIAQDSNKDYSKLISGRFMLKGADCAGYNFINASTLLWYNEKLCNSPDTLNIRWLDNNTFMARSTEKIDKSCPPLVYVIKVISFDGKYLVLKDMWTGWGDLKDERLELTKK